MNFFLNYYSGIFNHSIIFLVKFFCERDLLTPFIYFLSQIL